MSIYSNQDDNTKGCQGWRYYLPKWVINNYSVIINGKKLLRSIGRGIKWYEEIIKLSTRQCGNDNTGFLLHYRLIIVELSRQKQVDADLKAIQKIEFVGQIKNPDDAIVANKSILVLKIYKNQRIEVKFFLPDV